MAKTELHKLWPFASFVEEGARRMPETLGEDWYLTIVHDSRKRCLLPFAIVAHTPRHPEGYEVERLASIMEACERFPKHVADMTAGGYQYVPVYRIRL